MSFEREIWIGLEALQGKRASSRIEAEILWFFSSCGRKIEVPLELPRGPQGTSRIASGKSSLLSSWKGNSGLLSSSCSGKAHHLPLRGESRGVSRVVEGSFGFLSSCDWDHREPLMLPQGSQASFHVVRGTSGFLSSCCSGIRPHLALRG